MKLQFGLPSFARNNGVSTEPKDQSDQEVLGGNGADGESSDIDEARQGERERANGASGKRCDIDTAKRRSQTENWEVRVNQIEAQAKACNRVSKTHRTREPFPAGIEPTSKV